MTQVWVDTDFGFDDLWALLVLRHLGVQVAGVSLVAGNAPLSRVIANALGAHRSYGFAWPLYQGAARPLTRDPETAERILGPFGMVTRGLRLPEVPVTALPEALPALQNWLTALETPREVLALGPLTNIALLLQSDIGLVQRVSRVVWMGGSSGPGNHTPLAEFNAVADAEALAVVLASGVRLDVVDLTFCRKVTFAEEDMPDADPLTRDLLGGYLDIALNRGRPGMAIYDPLAAVAVARPLAVGFSACDISVSTQDDATYGATKVTSAQTSATRIATGAQGNLAAMCLGALTKDAINGP